MNIAEAFTDYLEQITGSVLGQDLFIGQAPSTNKVPDDIYWIVASGGNINTDTTTGEKLKNYTIEVYKRSRDNRTIYDDMQDLEIELNCLSCIELSGYEVVDIEAYTLSIDNDLDNEDRKVGLLQVNLIIYKGDCDYGSIS